MASADSPPWAVERLLRELLAGRQLRVEELERRLGWEPGRLADFLSGAAPVAFGEVLPVLGVLDCRPAELFARLYGFAPEDVGLAQPRSDARFEESLRVVREAMLRRSTQGRSGASKG